VGSHLCHPGGGNSPSAESPRLELHLYLAHSELAGGLLFRCGGLTLRGHRSVFGRRSRTLHRTSRAAADGAWRVLVAQPKKLCAELDAEQPLQVRALSVWRFALWALRAHGSHRWAPFRVTWRSVVSFGARGLRRPSALSA